MTRFLALMVALSFPLAARAGADSSGGGKSVVCRDTSGKILSVEMLDLYEARNLYGQAPLAMGSTVDEVMTAAKAKFSHTSFASSYLPEALDQLRAKLHVLPAGQKLTPIDDADPVIYDPGCKLEQAAVWVDSTLIVADRELWEAMDTRNQVALYAHETIYAAMRAEGDKNSRRARKIVGYVFSQFNFTWARAGLPAEPRILCLSASQFVNSTASEFWIYPDVDGNLVAQFEILHGRDLYDRTTAVYTGLAFDEKARKNVGVFEDLNSNFETGRTFMLSVVASSDGRTDMLSTAEFDRDGNEVAAEVRCTKQP